MVKTKNSIPTSQWLYARADGLSWIQADGKSTKMDKVFINKAYLLNNSLEIKDYLDNATPPVATPSPSKNYPLIELEAHEKFRSDDGIIHEVMVRGERHYQKIFFRLRDIAAMLQKDYKSLVDQLVRTNGETSYVQGLHYLTIKRAESTHMPVASEYYLTFNGVGITY